MNGLTWKDVERVCSFAEASRTLAGLRDSAMINLKSDCLLRVSEVVMVNVGDIKGSVLHIKSSKTEQDGKAEALYICEATRRVIKRYLRKSGIKRGASGRGAVFTYIVKGDLNEGKGTICICGARRRARRGVGADWDGGFAAVGATEHVRGDNLHPTKDCETRRHLGGMVSVLGTNGRIQSSMLAAKHGGALAVRGTDRGIQADMYAAKDSGVVSVMDKDGSIKGTLEPR